MGVLRFFKMKTKVLIVGVIVLAVPLFILLTGGSLPFLSGKKKAALQITSIPKAKVFLNDIHQGSTPFKKEDLKPQEYKIKLEPEGGLPSWEARVNIVSGMMTVIAREFSTSEALSSGLVLTLEKITDKEKAGLTVITDPDNSIVNLDGEPRGFSPINLSNLKAGSHILLVSSPGFKEKTQEIQLFEGYKLNASVKLAKDESQEKEEEEDKESEEDEEATGSSKKKKQDKDEEEEEEVVTSAGGKEGDDMERPYVKIKETGTGWLRVRSDPIYQADNDNEVAKVDVGGVYKLLDETESGWYEIEYEVGESGWISGKYTERYD